MRVLMRAAGFENGIRKPEKEKEIRWSLWVGRVCVIP